MTIEAGGIDKLTVVGDLSSEVPTNTFQDNGKIC